MEHWTSSRLMVAAVVLAFLLLIGAVWSSDVSVAASLALTSGVILIGVGTVALIVPARHARDRSDDQRDRMEQTTP